MRFRSVAAAWLAVAIALVGSSGLATAQTAAPAATQPGSEELLGFSRYLPADTRGYVSALQLGKLRSEVAASNAWQRIESIPEVKQGLTEVTKQLESNEVPPAARAALELLKAAGESEISFAAGGDSSQDVLNLLRTVFTSFVVFAPSPHDPDSLQGRTLEAKRAPIRVEWTTAVPKVRMPSMVFAARVKNPAKHRAFLETMLDLGWQGVVGEIERKAIPEFREPLKKAYSQVKLGEVTMRRFHLRLGDVVPAEGLAEGIERLPLGEVEKRTIERALLDQTIDVHLGFLGEYLTLAIGSDDRFIKQIVERFEGRSQETLAASAGFATIRNELAASALGVVYSDNSGLQRELQSSIMPLINKLADPELHTLLGAKSEITTAVHRVQFGLESAIAAMPLRQESVIKAEQGLKQYLRSEFDREPAVVPTTALPTLKMIPEKAIAYSIIRNGTMENYLEQAKYLIAQQVAQLESMKQRFGPNAAANFAQQIRLLESLVTTIDEKFVPSLQGEMGVVLGGFADFGVKEGRGPPVRGIPVPTLALLVHSAEADKAIDGVRDLFKTFVEAATAERRGRGGEFPVEFVKHDLDGIETWIFKGDVMIIDGLEPHFAKVGGALVFSTSFELTKKMRDAAKGTSPAVTAAPVHQSMQDLLPVGAQQATFLNGAELNRSLRSTSAAVFGLIEKSPEVLNLRQRDLENVPNVKRAIEIGLTFAECFRGAASSMVSEGRFDVLREWVKIEDLEAK